MAIVNSFIKEFSSVRLAIVLLIFLVFTTLIGTVLPQEPTVGFSEILEKYGEGKYKLFKSIGLTDVFHSWWYLALLFTFALNLTTASFKRVFPKSKLAFLFPIKIKTKSITKLPVYAELPLTEKENKSFIEKVEKKLSEKKYKTKIEDGQLIAIKGAWHKLGASITHIGIMILLIGGAYSVLTGFNGMVQLSEKEGFYAADLGQSTNQIRSCEPENWLSPISKMPIWLGRTPSFLIKVNKTWREDYKTGEPKQWYTDLSVLDENKKELTRKTIHVNDPLQFMGFDVYQSNWGKFANISFNRKTSTFPVENIDGKELVLLPLSEDIVLKFSINEDNGDHKTMKTMKPKDHGDHKTMETIEIYSIYQKEITRERYIGTIKKNESIQVGPTSIGYLGKEELTGLQFKSNPGDFLIYPGVFFMILGVLVAFGTRKQIWASIDNENNKIFIGGKSDRMKKEFQKEFESIIYEISSGKEPISV